MLQNINKILLLSLLSFKVLGFQILDQKTYLNQIMQYHPVVKQADLRVAQTKSEVRAERGIFDPMINMAKDAKTLDGKKYYEYQNADIKLFTPLGLSLKAGVENNLGENLNSEATVGKMSYLGIELPLLKGLLIDKKRAALKQAQIYQNLTEIEKKQTINDLLLEALNAYCDWATSYYQLTIIDKNLILADNQFALTKTLFQNGDRSPADTTEAQSQVLTLQLEQTKYNIELIKNKILVSNYIWGSDNSAYILEESVLPDTNYFDKMPNIETISKLTEQLDENPLLKTYTIKLESLKLDQRLKRQSLLPELTISQNILSKGYYSFEGKSSPFLTNNYKYGINFNVPLFRREARALLEKNKLKIEETNWMLKQKSREVKTKLQQFDRELNNINTQIATLNLLNSNNGRLLALENLKFSQGESSLFLINSRQNKVLENEIKVTQTKNKFMLTWFKQQWVSGNISKMVD